MEPVAANEVEQRGRHQSASEPAEFKRDAVVCGELADSIIVIYGK